MHCWISCTTNDILAFGSEENFLNNNILKPNMIAAKVEILLVTKVVGLKCIFLLLFIYFNQL